MPRLDWTLQQLLAQADYHALRAESLWRRGERQGARDELWAAISCVAIADDKVSTDDERDDVLRFRELLQRQTARFGEGQ